MPWRYVRNNEYVTLTPTSGIRTVEDIRYRMAALLLHELAHANDFLSPARVVAADPSRTVLDIAIGGVIPSSQLSNVSPLRSQMMLGLGQVSFQGETASELQKSLVPPDIASEFSTDAASDYYNYSTTREDFAMLFEEAMMLYLFGIDRDVGVTNKPESGAPCADYIVEWGVRNRVLDQQVRDRAVRAIGDALPEAQGMPPLKTTLGHSRLEVLVGSFLGPLIGLVGDAFVGSPVHLAQQLGWLSGVA